MKTWRCACSADIRETSAVCWSCGRSRPDVQTIPLWVALLILCCLALAGLLADWLLPSVGVVVAR